MPLVTSVTGGPVPVVSRAAQEWLRPPACAEHFQQAVFLSGRGKGGLVSVCANFTQTLYHPSGGLSRGGLKGEGELTANVPNIFDFYHIYGVILRIIIDIDSYGYRSFGLLVVILDAVDGNINGFKYIF